MIPLEKAELANTEMAVFLLNFGSLFDCVFLAFVSFYLAVKDMHWLCIVFVGIY